jgi:hypothetical protein
MKVKYPVPINKRESCSWKLFNQYWNNCLAAAVYNGSDHFQHFHVELIIVPHDIQIFLLKRCVNCGPSGW